MPPMPSTPDQLLQVEQPEGLPENIDLRQAFKMLNVRLSGKPDPTQNQQLEEVIIAKGGLENVVPPDISKAYFFALNMPLQTAAKKIKRGIAASFDT